MLFCCLCYAFLLCLFSTSLHGFSTTFPAYSDLRTDLPMHFSIALSLSLAFSRSRSYTHPSHTHTQLKLSRPARRSRPAPSSADPSQSASSAAASASGNDSLFLPRRRSSDGVARRATRARHSLKIGGDARS